MSLDSRLVSLKDAIKEDWDMLEAVEEDGRLVIGIKPGNEYDKFDASIARSNKKDRNLTMPMPH